MDTKFLEVRDRLTYIPVLAIKMVHDNPIQSHYLRRHGYRSDTPIIVLMKIGEVEAHSDPHAWGLGRGCRTMTTAHMYIQEAFDRLSDGDVVDAEYILGESAAPKVSERIERA